MRRTTVALALLACLHAACVGLGADTPVVVPANSVTNGGFESGLAGWRPFWTREPNAGSVAVDTAEHYQGTRSARIEHRLEKDWSFEPAMRVPARAGDIFELEAWVKLQGSGTLTLCASTWDAQGKPLAWALGERSVHELTAWRRVRCRFVVSADVAEVQPRLIGHGPVKAWVDQVSFRKLRNANELVAAGLPAQLSLTNKALTLTWDTGTRTLSVMDQRTGRRWLQREPSQQVVVAGARLAGEAIELTLQHLAFELELRATIRLERETPEVAIELAAAGECPGAVQFPSPFLSQVGDYVVIPMNEGISYPVEDSSIEPFRLIAYGGHGICMAFWGVTDGALGHMAILETPDDAAIRLQRVDQKLVVAPEWDPQRGQFGYSRRVRYVFFEQGGHVAICKRYRQYAKETGLLKTLAEKRRDNPNVDMLIGAVNIWCWERNSVPLVKEMQAAGIRRILWSNQQSPENLKALNELDVLTSRYDIYQDVMDPANFKNLRGVHADWTTAAWPGDIVTKADGSWLKGWDVKGKDDQWYACGVICDKRAPDYARERIPAELATRPYRSRFIDTTTAAPWHECYDPKHPMTRTESRQWKMQLLEYVSRDMKLVTGCETGHDASVPFLHYFEGMLSLGPYRVPDSGRDMQRIWTDVPERVAKFQVGEAYRLPLWELVYHDCVVAQWYWGDYNNKLPSLWDKRDLFNLLYGTPPMFMFNQELWTKHKDRFVRSYQVTCPVAREVGYAEMLDHRFLTRDRRVQQTRFANGVTITANFGAQPWSGAGLSLKPMGYHIAGARSLAN